MPIVWHGEHDGRDVMLSKIKSMDDAVSLRCFFSERGIGGALAEPAGEHDFRLVLVGVSIAEFSQRIAGSDIKLID